MVSNTLLAKQPRFWNGKSKRRLGIKAAPGGISLSLRRQGSPQHCLTFASHLKRRQEGGKQITDGSEFSSLSVLWTVPNMISAHDKDYGALRPFPPLFFSLWSFATAEAAKSFDRMRHLVRGPTVWFRHKATSLVHYGQQGSHRQPRHMGPQSTVRRQKPERQLMREKGRQNHRGLSLISEKLSIQRRDWN